MKVERVFNNNSNITFEDIILSLIDKEVDRLIDDYYHQNKVNTATSHEEGDVLAWDVQSIFVYLQRKKNRKTH